MSDEPKRGVKRKRPEPRQKDPEVKLRGKLHHIIKEVRKSAKKAKTFETQKLVKKLKSPRTNSSDDIEQLEEQLRRVKSVSPDHLACLALVSKIRKDQQLSTVISENDVTSSFPSPPTSEDSKNIDNRLLSSKALAETIAQSLQQLRSVIAPNTPVPEETKLPSAKRTKSSEVTEPASSDHSTDTEEVREGNSDAVVDPLDSGIEDSVDDAGWESGTVDEDEDEKGHTSSAAASTRTKAQSTSTFLPSLAVGYVRGSDESFSDDEAQIADGARKNRRGQRARRAIWEKKFGRNANHVKKEREKNPKPRLQDGKRLRQPRFTHAQPASGGPRQHEPEANRGRDSSVPSGGVDKIHPSWEAKRREKEKQSARIVPSQGKKITF